MGKNNKGVSIIMLVIAIAMIAIIASFAVFYSQNTTPEAKMASGYSSLKVVKDASNNALTLIELNSNEYDEFHFFGKTIQQKYTDITKLTQIAADCGLGSYTDFSERTYEIKPAETEEEELLLKNLELKGIKDTYIIDLENNKYYILGGIELMDGDVLYEYKDILSEYQILVGEKN